MYKTEQDLQSIYTVGFFFGFFFLILSFKSLIQSHVLRFFGFFSRRVSVEGRISRQLPELEQGGTFRCHELNPGGMRGDVHG